ncbi:hypothetical protein [Candidatus Electronema sp. PJ]|uniref:hypothetical protein n=1 Tax=Candidatus Electronema sp. PJ TaxID=3401572 RepID=UPI003AA8BD08
MAEQQKVPVKLQHSSVRQQKVLAEQERVVVQQEKVVARQKPSLAEPNSFAARQQPFVSQPKKLLCGLSFSLIKQQVFADEEKPSEKKSSRELGTKNSLAGESRCFHRDWRSNPP